MKPDDDDKSEHEDDDVSPDTTVESEETVQSTHPIRKAVIEARRKLKQWLSSDDDEASLGSIGECRGYREFSDITVISLYALLRKKILYAYY